MSVNEDLKPIYDIEADWRPLTSGKEKRIIFENSNYPSLCRIIDMEKELIGFTDVERIDKVVDINKVLVKEDNPEENWKKYGPIINRMLDNVRPITMPYVPEKLHAYIECFPGFNEDTDDTLGILYFWNKPTKEVLDENGGVLESEMIPCKKYFRILTMGSRVR